MDVRELIKEEYKTVFGIEEDTKIHSPESYKKLTKECEKKKSIQNSVEIYQSEQRLQQNVNNPFISQDEYIKHPIDCHLPEMNNSHIFRITKKEVFSKAKNDLSYKNKNNYSEYISNKCFLLSIQAIEENKPSKAIILYYSGKLNNKKIITPDKLFKFLIQVYQ